MGFEEFESALQAAEAIRLSDSAGALSEAHRLLPFAANPEHLGRTYLLLAQASNNLAKHQDAYEFAIRAYQVIEPQGYQLALARCLNTIALSEASLGNRRKGIQRLRQTLALAEEHGDVRSQIQCTLNLGFMFAEEGLLEQSIEWDARGIALLDIEFYPNLAVNLHNNRAFDLARLGRGEEAQYHITECFKHLNREEDPVMYALALDTKTYVDEALGNLDQALSDLDEAVDLQEQSGNHYRLIESTVRRGTILRKLGQLQASLEELNAAQKLSSEDPSTPFLDAILLERSRVAFDEGDFEKAYNLLEESRKVKLEFVKREFSDLSQNLAAGHQIDLAQREADILREKNRELFESQQRFELAVKGSDQGIFDGFLDEEEAFFSRRFVELLGSTPNSLEDVWNLLHTDDVAVHADALDEARARGYYTSEVRLKGQETYFWARLTAVLEPSADGRVRMVGSLSAIDAQKQAEAELIRGRERAEEMNRLKSEFLANMSHEIRTPMNGVLGLTELLLLGDPTPEQQETLQTIHSCGQSLLKIINDVLDFSKIEAGKVDMETEPFDLVHILRDIESLYRGESKRRGLQLRLVAPMQELRVVGDEVRVRQVVSNLVSNALKFTETGEVCIRLDARPLGETQQVAISIEDTGIGIPQDCLAHIFESFTQADGSTTRKYGGTGLGLTICDRLITLMQGHLEVSSTVGQGSCFTVRIDLPNAEPIQGDRGGSQLSGERTVKVLLVEDHLVNRRLASAQLRKLGCEVYEAENGEVATELVQKEHFDLVFMDLMMPVMDGLEATQAIRALPQFARLPIVALTANARPEDRERCLHAGMNDYLSKPFVLRDLKDMLDKWAPNAQSLAA